MKKFLLKLFASPSTSPTLLLMLMVLALPTWAGGGNEGGAGTAGATSGSLQLSGLSAYDGRWVIAVATGKPDLCAAAAVSITGPASVVLTGASVSGGTATLKVWETRDDSLLSFNGSGARDLVIYIFKQETVTNTQLENPGLVAATGVASVTFTRGVGSVGSPLIIPRM
jgi:hypothetical protein